MTDNNYNIINPIESLHNVTGLIPVKERKERNSSQNRKDKNQKRPEETRDKPSKLKAENEAHGQQNHSNTIDYCA